MKKIIRLTESDLNRLVKRIITEQNDDRDRALSQNGGEPRRVLPMRNRNLETSGYENDGRLLMLRNERADVVSEYLNNIDRNTKFIAIINCEYADFSGIDICGSDRIVVNLKGTDNNFDEQGYDCANEVTDGMYDVSGQSM